MVTGTSDYMTVKAAAAYLAVSPSTLNKLRCHGGGPMFYKFGRAVRYKVVDLDAWAIDRAADSTSTYHNKFGQATERLLSGFPARSDRRSNSDSAQQGRGRLAQPGQFERRNK
jgi:excisionase family DNA binding protein